MARKQLQEIRRLNRESTRNFEWRGSLVRSSLVFAADADGARRAGVLAMNWRLFVGASILVVALMFKVGAPLVAIVRRRRAGGTSQLVDPAAQRRRVAGGSR